ncbi:MAG: SMC family ATPase [Anaerolineales bacterium]|nr:SMC family ATPase [Anaerolineales bacterium]
MIPLSITISGFLSYQEPVEIDFTTFDLACISGQNGAGKSSILDAMTWALFGRARKHDESIINTQSDTAQVSFTFQYEGNIFRVLRTNPRGETKNVEFHLQQRESIGEPAVWKPLTERTLRETDQKIEETLRLDYETFINAAFFLQGEADQFTQQSPSARKRILSQILGLSIWETYRKRAFRKRKGVEAEISRMEGRLTEILSELEQENERRRQLKELKSELEKAVTARKAQEDHLADIQSLEASLQEQSKLVENLSTQKDKLIQKTQKLNQRLESRETDQENFSQVLSRAEQIKEQAEAWEQAQEELTRWEQIAEKFRESEKKRQGPLTEIAAEKARLTQELNNLQTRSREIHKSLEEIPVLQKKLIEKEQRIAQAEEKLKSRELKQEELEKARQNQAEAKAENPRLYQEMKKLEKRIDNLQKTEGAECPLCGQPLSSTEREKLINDLTKQGQEMGDRFRKNKETLSRADQVVKKLQLEITELSLVDDQLRELNQEADKLSLRISQINQQKEEWEKQDLKRMEEINSQLQEETYALQARKELAEIDAQLKEIGYDAHQHDKIKEQVEQGKNILQELRELEKARAALEPLEREINDLSAEIDAESQELEETSEMLKLHSASLEKARGKAPDKKQAEQELLNRKEEENILQRELGAAQQKVNVLAAQKERRTQLEEKQSTLRDQVSQLKQLEEAFGKNGVPALLIEQALPQIEAKANEILERLSGGSMSVRFITQREYKDQTRDDLKETLDIQIQDRAGVRDYEMFSGGESFRINFAIRLALSHVLAQRAGARLQTLVIDEGFGSQDEIGRQRLIEAINLIQNDFKKILVITHIDQLKDVFTNQLVVEKTSRGSMVTVL